MREIKFRGVTYDGRTLYGDLIQRHGKVYINEECGECIVKPESVAQLVYRNIFLKEFYEGDTFTDVGFIRRAELRADFPVYDGK